MDFATGEFRPGPETERLLYWRRDYLPPEVRGLSSSPELQTLVRKYYRAGWAWSEARRREFFESRMERETMSPETSVMIAVNEALGVRSFRMDIRILPVEGAEAWRSAADRVLVSESLYSDTDAFIRWLHPVLEDLASGSPAVDTKAPELPAWARRERVELSAEEQELVLSYARKREMMPGSEMVKLFEAHGRSHYECQIEVSRDSNGTEVAYLMCKPLSHAPDSATES